MATRGKRVEKSAVSVDKSQVKSRTRRLTGVAVDPSLRGRGPKKGAPNAGRPPDAWKALCRELASSDELIEKAKLVLRVPNHPAWLGAWKFLTEQGYGKPTQPVEGDMTLRIRFE